MDKIKFVSIDIFKSSSIESDKIIGGYGQTCVPTMICTASNPNEGDTPQPDCSEWT